MIFPRNRNTSVWRSGHVTQSAVGAELGLAHGEAGGKLKAHEEGGTDAVGSKLGCRT